MARRFMTAITLAGLLVGLAGCSGGAKPTDPKLGAGVKEDPRLKPAGIGGSEGKGAVTTP
jgi:hypothetical protein